MPGWDWNAFGRYLISGYLLEGAWTTIWLSVVVMVLGLLLGLVAAIMNMSKSPVLQGIAKFYLFHVARQKEAVARRPLVVRDNYFWALSVPCP